MKTAPIDSIVVGTCGLCGGPVCVPRMWWGVNRPPPVCNNCGAVAQEQYGPVMPMTPPEKTRTFGESTIAGTLKAFDVITANFTPDDYTKR